MRSDRRASTATAPLLTAALIASLALMASFVLETAKADEAKASDDSLWMTDFSAALEKAKKEKKDVLVDFTGSDWCGWCIRLSGSVFETETFKKSAPEKFVLVELDFPRGKTLSPDLRKQNDRLQEEFAVQGFPTILLLDAKGLPYARTGYQPGGPESYLKHLDELQAVRKTRDDHLAKAEEAKGAEKAKHLDAALAALDPSLVALKYDDVVDRIIELDADNEAGLKAKYELARDIVELEQAAMASVRSGGAEREKVITRIDAAIGKAGEKGQNAQRLLILKAQLLLNAPTGPDTHLGEVVSLVEKAIAADPESEASSQLSVALGSLKERLSQSKGDDDS